MVMYMTLRPKARINPRRPPRRSEARPQDFTSDFLGYYVQDKNMLAEKLGFPLKYLLAVANTVEKLPASMQQNRTASAKNLATIVIDLRKEICKRFMIGNTEVYSRARSKRR